jgi:uncharacterized membrane protein YdjX (TVP38/TMEM64 family)
VPAFLAIGFISLGLWWFLAFSWEGDPPPIIAYVFLWAAIGSGPLAALAAIGAVISGVAILITKFKIWAVRH